MNLMSTSASFNSQLIVNAALSFSLSFFLPSSQIKESSFAVKRDSKDKASGFSTYSADLNDDLESPTRAFDPQTRQVSRPVCMCTPLRRANSSGFRKITSPISASPSLLSHHRHQFQKSRIMLSARIKYTQQGYYKENRRTISLFFFPQRAASQAFYCLFSPLILGKGSESCLGPAKRKEPTSFLIIRVIVQDVQGRSIYSFSLPPVKPSRQETVLPLKDSSRESPGLI